MPQDRFFLFRTLARPVGMILLVLTCFTFPSAGATRGTAKAFVMQALHQWEAALAEREMEDFARDLEHEFVLRLKFQVERRYTGEDASMVRILAFMLELEEQPQNLSLSYTTRFLRELIEAVRTLREPNENLIRFIRQFTEIAGIQNGLSAEEFAQTRAYVNARETEGAEPLDDEMWNEISERLEESPGDDTPAAPPAEPENTETPPVMAAETRAGPETPERSALMSGGANEGVDPELLQQLETEDEVSPAPLEQIFGGSPPAAPRAGTIRPADDSLRLSR